MFGFLPRKVAHHLQQVNHASNRVTELRGQVYTRWAPKAVWLGKSDHRQRKMRNPIRFICLGGSSVAFFPGN